MKEDELDSFSFNEPVDKVDPDIILSGSSNKMSSISNCKEESKNEINTEELDRKITEHLNSIPPACRLVKDLKRAIALKNQL